MPDQSSAANEHALIQEITAPLETLPDDPLALVEADFPTAMRGYDRHAVDDYVMQMSRLVAELQATRSPEAAVRRALERVGDQISGILQRAHETAEQITAQSRGEAEDRLEQARREGAALVDAAEQRVRELDADADRIWSERQQIVADAEDLSQRLHDVVREAGERFPVEDVRGAGAPGLEELAPADPDADAVALEQPGATDPGAVAAYEAEDDAPFPEDDEALDPDTGGVFAPQAGGVFDPEDDEALDAEDEEPLDAEDEEPLDAEDEEPLEAGDAQAFDPEDGKAFDPEDPGEEDDPGIERTVPFTPQRPTPPPDAGSGAADARTEPLPRRFTDDDSTQIIPPASDAAQHRRDT